MSKKVLSNKSTFKCPNNNPYYCTSKTNSFGLCSKSVKNCDNRKKKHKLPITKKTSDNITQKFAYENKHLLKDCYPKKKEIDLEVKKWKKGDDVPDNFKIITYNIWGLSRGNKNDKLYCYEKRMSKIKDILLNSNADILCLQEMSSKSYKKLILKYKILKKHYPYISKLKINNKDATVFLLSKIKPKEIRIYNTFGNLGYQLRIMIVKYNNLTVFNIHSQAGCKYSPGQELKWMHYARCRKEHFRYIKDLMKKFLSKPVILLGDFNCHLDGDLKNWPETNEFNSLKFTDIWKHLKKNKKGLTEDTKKNLMRWNLKQLEKQFRYDGIKYNKYLKGVNTKMLGTEPFLLTKTQNEHYKKVYELDKKKIRYTNKSKMISMWPSDHFGVMSEFHFKK
jgi:exonuclease III